MASLIDYLYNASYKKEQLFKIIQSFSLHKKFHKRINFVKMRKIFFIRESFSLILLFFIFIYFIIFFIFDIIRIIFSLDNIKKGWSIDIADFY